MSKPLKVIKDNASNPKLWIVVGIGVAAVVIVAERRRRKRRVKAEERKDFGAFVDRFELLPFPQPPPPAARQLLSGLTFAIKDMFVSRTLLWFKFLFSCFSLSLLCGFFFHRVRGSVHYSEHVLFVLYSS